MMIAPPKFGELLRVIFPIEVPGDTMAVLSTVTAPVMEPLPVSQALDRIVNPLANECVPLVTRFSVARLTPAPRKDGLVLLTRDVQTVNVPPLNSKKPNVLVSRSVSASTTALLFIWLVPRRISKLALA